MTVAELRLFPHEMGFFSPTAYDQVYLPRVIGHRGFSARFPENSLLAFEAAIRAGAHGIELDIQMTRDGIAVIYHDETLHQLGMGDDQVRMNSAAAFADSLPVLDEVLSFFGRRAELLLEIKHYDGDFNHGRKMVDEVLTMIAKHELQDRSYILCFDLDLLRYGNSRDPDCRFVLNQLTGRRVDAPFLSAYSVHWEGLRPDFCSQVRALGKEVFCFTCNDLSQIRHALACGVDGIMSDDVSFLAETLARQNHLVASVS